MNGLTIITGINYSGKGCVIEALKEVWSRRLSIDASFITASHHIRQLGRLVGYGNLASLPVEERNLLRLASFQQIAQEARRNPVFLDAHFVFEDGEHVDFQPLADVTRQIVVVRCVPEIVYTRALSDTASDHPGRVLLRNADIAFIRRYQDADTEAAQRFAFFVSQTQKRTVGFYPIDNSFNEDTLHCAVETMVPRLYHGFEAIGLPYIER